MSPKPIPGYEGLLEVSRTPKKHAALFKHALKNWILFKNIPIANSELN